MRILTLYQMLKPQINLYEANLKNLYTKSISETPRMAARGKQMTGDVRYFGLSKDGTINFKVKSQTRSGRYHYVAIDCPDIIRFGEVVESGDHFNVSDLMKLLTMKGFRIHCHCEAFLYYAFQYMATQGDYEIQPETRAPKRNNTTLSGGLCKHLIATVYNLYNNRKMQESISKDIDNYLRMLAGLDYDDYQQLNHAKQIQQQNRSVKWKNKPSDFMNEYFARQAKSHEFLDDHDIKKSLKKEMNKFIHANPYGSVDDFLRDYFQMTKKAFADDMKVPEDSIDDYFNELGFEEKTHKWQEKREAKNNPPTVEDAPEVMEDTGEEDTTSDEVLPERNSILDKDSEQVSGNLLKEGINDKSWTESKENLFNNIKKIKEQMGEYTNKDNYNDLTYSQMLNIRQKEHDRLMNYYSSQQKIIDDFNHEINSNEEFKKELENYYSKKNESEEVTEYFTKAEAHQKYQEYLTGHIGNVQEALKLIISITKDSDNPIAQFIQENKEVLLRGCKQHDQTKYDEVEYYPYLHHFYPTCEEDSRKTEEFEQACRHHVRNNKHHWDFWLNEDTGELDINDEFDYKIHTIERVCDWLSMAKQHDEGKRDWYDANKDSIQQPDYGWEITDYLFDIIPDDYYLNLSFGGTRGKLDENEEGTK